MGLNWPSASMYASELDQPEETRIRAALDLVGDRLADLLATAGWANHVSPLFRPWGLFVGVQPTQILVAFIAAPGGLPPVHFADLRTRAPAEIPIGAFASQFAAQQGSPLAAAFILPPLSEGDDVLATSAKDVAMAHFQDVERSLAFQRLGDVTGFEHLEAPLRSFLSDHPEVDRNVFIMMRFQDTAQMAEIIGTIRSSLASRGLTGLRADDREYSPELWPNVQTYMLGSRYGIAVFEDIETRDFNPNVSLELGFMLARRRRCLLLKEKRLPRLPTDVTSHLYKEFDAFDIQATINEQVLRWINVDLGL